MAAVSALIENISTTSEDLTQLLATVRDFNRQLKELQDAQLSFVPVGTSTDDAVDVAQMLHVSLSALLQTSLQKRHLYNGAGRVNFETHIKSLETAIKSLAPLAGISSGKPD